jgi:hypothetical protein
LILNPEQETLNDELALERLLAAKSRKAEQVNIGPAFKKFT